MTGRRVCAALLLTVVAALGPGRTPSAVVPAQIGLIATAAKHRPARGPSRDRTLPGKARRRARRTR